MAIKYITGGRQTGKTTKLIKAAVEDPKSVIVVPNNNYRCVIQEMLFTMYNNSLIVPVVTFKDLCNHSAWVDGKGEKFYKLYFDNIMECLCSMIQRPLNYCDIAAAVVDIEEERKMPTDLEYYIHDVLATFGLFEENLYIQQPHIDHVKFNGPATIVFWKDGTKTVVKYDGKGRKDKRMAIMYAFMRKIYGEGRGYTTILSEIEEALK